MNIEITQENITEEKNTKSLICSAIKRTIDIIGAVVGIIALIPLTIGTFIANLISKDKGPVFYTQNRIGKDGKTFKMYKFRTMYENAQDMIKDFTPEQMKILSANPFTYKVSAICIHYTLEFKNLFLAHYEAGEPVKDIFAAFGYDPAILGDNRMHAFARRISKQAKEGKVPTEDSSSVKIQKPAKVDYNTLPAQQSVSAMQREIAYLRQQIEFLKKITELDNDRKPRT